MIKRKMIGSRPVIVKESVRLFIETGHQQQQAINKTDNRLLFSREHQELSSFHSNLQAVNLRS
jgi:hypothetical protein